jgi:membrane dipeptidase
MSRAEVLHNESIVFDMVSPLFMQAYPKSLEEYRAGNVTALGVTVFNPEYDVVWDDARNALYGIAQLLSWIGSRPDEMTLIETVEDFARAKSSKRLGILMHFQNATQFENAPELIETFYKLGVRVSQLTYNTRNFLGDGCKESVNAGLSRLGAEMIAEMNRVGMVVDVSHAGERTSLEAIEKSVSPVIFSHSGCKAVYDNPRNITDEQIRACAASGGVVGIVGLTEFLGDARQGTMQQFLRHITHVSELVGVSHVGIGFDYYTGTLPYTPLESQEKDYAEMVANGDTEGLPPPPWANIPELETPALMPNLTKALLEAGFNEQEVKGILGENFLRVFGQVWKPARSEA